MNQENQTQENRRYKMSIRNLLFISILFVLAACNDHTEEIANVFYPIHIGSTWSYECTSYMREYDSTGVVRRLSHIIQPQVVTVTKDTVINGIRLRQLRTQYFEKYNVDYKTFYYKQTSDGLRFYGYSRNEFSGCPEEIIDSGAQRIQSIVVPRFKAKSDFSDVWLFKTPLWELPSTLSENMKWHYNLDVYKQVIGKDTLLINGKSYECYKVEMIEPSAYQYYYEWISTAGVLKREFETVRNDWNPYDKSYGSYISHEITIARSLTLK